MVLYDHVRQLSALHVQEERELATLRHLQRLVEQDALQLAEESSTLRVLIG